MLAAAPADPLAPASIAALVQIRALVRRLRSHASITIIPGDDAPQAAEATESYRLEPGGDENEFLAQVWARYRQGGYRAIRFSRHDRALTAHLSKSADDERYTRLADQLAEVSAQLAVFNQYLAHVGGDPAAAPLWELRERSQNS